MRTDSAARRSAARTRWAALGTCALAMAAAACSADAGGSEPADLRASDGEHVSTRDQEMQLALASFTGTRLVIGSLKDSPLAKSVAALRLTDIDSSTSHGSCGATFVSPHYAVTAAHCVSHLDLWSPTLEVEEITMRDDLPSAVLFNYTTVTGSWPNWQNGSLGPYHHALRHGSCRVTRRCDPNHGGRQRCPLPAGENADIALVHCGTREKTDYAVTTAILPPVFGLPTNIDELQEIDTDLYWFHEVLNLPIEPDGTQYWNHYGSLGSNRDNNWHYAERHQLLPLANLTWPNGSSYKSLAIRNGSLISMDTPSCHGTSGSGVFVAGIQILLGPVISAGTDSQIGGRLCDRMQNAQPGHRRTRYVRADVTARFATGASEVLSDR